MIKADIVNRVAEESDLPRAKAARAVNTILGAMKEALSEGKRIELRGFGVFEVRERKKGVGRNLKTGTEVAIPPGKTVRFKPGKGLKDLYGQSGEPPSQHHRQFSRSSNMAAMSDFSIVWLKQLKGPCVFCGDETGVGAVGWHQANPIGPVCVACMLDREKILGDLLMKARAQGNGGAN